MKKILGHGKKSPAKLVTSTLQNIVVLKEADQKGDEDQSRKDAPKSYKKALDSTTTNMYQMKLILYGDGGESEPKPDQIVKLVKELFEKELLFQMLDSILLFEFEARNDVTQIYNFIFRQKAKKAEEWVKKNPKVLQKLVDGYAEPDIALNCGKILREVIRSEALDIMLLNDPALFSPFWGYVQLPTFDIASDAFATFKLMLTKHKKVCAKFMLDNFDQVFGGYNKLLQSKNYVTKRQSLKLLGELLLNRANFNVMIKYINMATNLKIVMNLLRGNTKAIQFEAFHVFKIFVANPQKSKPVAKILYQNKDTLIDFLQKITKDQDAERFDADKQILLNTLRELEAPSPAPSPKPSPTKEGAESGTATTSTITATTTAATTSAPITAVTASAVDAPSAAVAPSATATATATATTTEKTATTTTTETTVTSTTSATATTTTATAPN